MCGAGGIEYTLSSVAVRERTGPSVGLHICREALHLGWMRAWA